MDVVVFAFNHADNIFAYTNALCKYTDISVTVILFSYGEICSSSSFTKNIRKFHYGLTTNNIRERMLPPELNNALDQRLNIWLLRLAPQKMSIKNVIISSIYLFLSYIKIKNKFQIYHFNGVGWHSLFLSYLFRNAKKVLTLHDYIPHSGEGGKYTSKMNRKLVNNFDYYIQHYDYLANEFSRYYSVERSKVFTIRSGTFEHFKAFVGVTPEYKNYILSFGRISLYKGLKYLVNGFREYCKENNDLHLVIAGAGDVSDILDMINKETKIHLINKRLSINEMTGLIQNCLFTVCSYTDATHSAVTVTSYTFNKPVLAHNIGGLSEVINNGETGILIPDLRAATIKEGIIKMLKLIHSNKTEKGISYLTNQGIMNWHQIANQYEMLYNIIGLTNK